VSAKHSRANSCTCRFSDREWKVNGSLHLTMHRAVGLTGLSEP